MSERYCGGQTTKKPHIVCEIIENRAVNDSVYRLTVASEALVAGAAPGQFALLTCEGTLLRRPLGFCNVDENAATATFMYQVKGAGTRSLSRRAVGEGIDILGPLGNGFTLLSGRAAVIGGGAGVFPLLFLTRRLAEAGTAADVFLGFRERGSVLLSDEFARHAANVDIVSDDGSTGRKGYVTNAFSEAVGRGAAVYDAVYACGPEPMLKETARVCAERGMTAQLSLEQRMGCGIGACLVCACAVKARQEIAVSGAGHTYARVCKDGPVFMSDAVVFEDER